MAKKLNIRELDHYVALCSGKDVVTEDGELLLIRKDVLQTWAKIEAKASSMYSPAGYAIMEPRDKQTHLITMRMRLDIDIASSAWIYEEREQSGARWFKVLGTKDMDESGNFIILSAKIIERGADLVTPVPDATEIPQPLKRVDHGVKL